MMVNVGKLKISIDEPDDELYVADVEPKRFKGESKTSFKFFKSVSGSKVFVKTNQGAKHVPHILRKIGYSKAKWSVKNVRRIRNGVGTEGLKTLQLSLSEKRK